MQVEDPLFGAKANNEAGVKRKCYKLTFLHILQSEAENSVSGLCKMFNCRCDDIERQRLFVGIDENLFFFSL